MEHLDLAAAGRVGYVSRVAIVVLDPFDESSAARWRDGRAFAGRHESALGADRAAIFGDVRTAGHARVHHLGVENRRV